MRWKFSAASLTEILHWRLEVAATQTKPAGAGFKPLIFCESAGRGLGVYSLRMEF